MLVKLDIPRQYQGVGMTSQRTRNRMVEKLETLGITNQIVLDVMRQIPRHVFVDEAIATRSYEDTWLPIGHRQTISRPYTVALMTQHLLEANSNRDVVLEIGTGSGYQTAVLSALFNQVYTVERIAPLQRRAYEILDNIGFNNISYHTSDGSWGWSKFAPYQSIIVTAAPEEIPTGLLEQMAQNSVMVIPVGGTDQQLMQVYKNRDNQMIESEIEAARFVPLVTEQPRTDQTETHETV